MTPRPRPGRWLGTLAAAALVAAAAPAGDWIHWRGPEMTGQAKEPSVPATFDLSEVGKGNLLWKQPVGGRSAPLVMAGRVYTINAYDPGLLTEGEQITCFNADTGAVLWNYKVNVYHAEVVTSRLGWTTLTADPETKHVFAHTTAGALLCLDQDGKLVWTRHLSEEFGRFTGYGGRIVSPIFDSGLVICAMINSSWGDNARGMNRFVALDGKTGEVVWWSEPGTANFGTYQSHPVVAVINGQRLLIAGGSDGAVHGIKVRTGQPVWKYVFSSGPINPAPVVDGNLVYSAHGEENPEGGAIGRVVCVDASQVKDGKPKLVWEYRRSNRFGLSHPAIADGRLYVPDDGGEMFCFNAKTGKLLWREKYGTTSRGAPLINGDKLYIFDVNAKLVVWNLNGNKGPDVADEYTFRVPSGFTGFVETHATPIAVNGRLYFTTSFETYCVGEPSGAPKPAVYKPMPPETPFDEKAAPAGAMLFPADVTTKPGGTFPLAVKFVDANGRVVATPAGEAVEWSFPVPPIPKGAAAAPPALKAKVQGDGEKAAVTIDGPAPPVQQGYVMAKAGKLTARSRVRVAAQVPFTTNFEMVPEGAGPAGWVNAQGKFTVVKLPDGNKVLSKVNTDGRIPIARANGYITGTHATDYTIECDIMATEVDNKLPDMGLVNNRYTFVLDGKKDPDTKTRTVRIVSWEARPRVNKVLTYDWQKDTWYHIKLRVEPGDKTATVRAKVWPKADKEPDAWTVEFEDPSPNLEGAAAVYGYISNIRSTAEPGSNIYYDNLKISPNHPAPKK